MDKDGLINSIVDELKKIEKIVAVVIGGSYASRLHRPDSDIDLGLYYREEKPFKIESIRLLANKLNDKPDPLVSDFGGWGYWVNGGTWLTVKKQRVDFIYRNLDFVEKVIEDCFEGRIESDFYQEPPAGFHSYIYLAEIEENKVLFDSENIMDNLKNKIKIYPTRLKPAIVNKFLWDSEFALSRAKKFAQRGEIYLTVSSLTRISHDLTQVAYTLNEKYFLSEKRVYKDFLKFKIIPAEYLKNMEEILGDAGISDKRLSNSVEKVSQIIEEFKSLAKNFYTPKYTK